MHDVAEPEFTVNQMQAVLFRDIRHALPNKPTVRTLRRWSTVGNLNRHTGERIKLPAIETPNGRATTIAAYQFMIRRLNEH